MPFKSEAQRVWAHSPEGTEALGGKAKVEEWEQATGDAKLPERKSPPKNRSPRKKPAGPRMRHTAQPR